MMNSGSPSSFLPFLKGKVAVVTGSSRGIGKAVAQKFASLGCSVVICYSSSSSRAVGEKTAAEIKESTGSPTLAVQVDTRQLTEIKSLFDKSVEHFKRLDICVSNAGIEHFNDFINISEEEYDKVYDTNTKGQFFVCQQAAKHMKEIGTKTGRIIVLSSISSTWGIARHSLYASSKGALVSMVKNLAKDLGPLDITINAVAPGGIATDMSAEVGHHYTDPNSKLTPIEQVNRMSPFNRIGTVEDVANAITLIVTPEGGWISGQTIIVGGGA